MIRLRRRASAPGYTPYAPTYPPGSELFVPRGHFYSPSTSPDDVARAVAETPAPNPRTFGPEQVEFASQLAPMWSELPRGRRWHDGWENDQFGLADAAVLSSMVRWLRPARVVEVGSGWSSAVLMDTLEAFDLTADVTFIEPDLTLLHKLLDAADLAACTVREEMVQDTPAEVFGSLTAGDLLFIDSTHILKAGSDVEHVLFRVLPLIPTGVVVHVHDMFWPWQYPQDWLQQHRDWNEIYAYHALLSGGDTWKVLLFSDWLFQHAPDLVAEHLPEAVGARPGSLWLVRS